MFDLYPLLQRLLFKLPPEKAHSITLAAVDHLGPLIRQLYPFKEKPRKAFGLTFPNPVGLAAGLDKDGDHLNALANLGFGFIEIGTVTPKPQIGNPKPRLFRLTEDSALINRMGFNNKGLMHCVSVLENRSFEGILGVNIGKNKDTPNESASKDYITCLEAIYPLADYITINISSPNTKNLRELQTDTYFDSFLSEIATARATCLQKHKKSVPLLVKVAPDNELAALEPLVKSCIRHEINGIIATNTTVSREGLHSLHASEVGGMSGAPLLSRANETLEQVHHLAEGRLSIIAAGGIHSKEAALEKFNRGAELVQLYTGLIYKGPQLIQDIINSM